MHIPNASISPPYCTREQHLRRALTLLKEKVDSSMRHPVVYEPELSPYTPRDEMNSFIFQAAQEALYGSDDRSMLYVAVEDLSLAQMRPETFVVDPDNPPRATYLIRMKKDPLHLILLAIEEPTLAHTLPTHYSDLVEANGQEISASLLLYCALIAHVETHLHQRGPQRQSGG
jgi:hypothetical protein